ncbi:MAG: hypothetical protein N2248_00315 [candidate division WOR-3 bacterium]|nr:hypothetical protein [candidate division WOR-3 bacterium]
MPSNDITPLSGHLPSRQERAFELDAIISQGFRRTVESIIEIGVALKEIRDQELYKELGYPNFEAYVVERYGLSRRSAYLYIGIAEKLPQEFVQRVAQIPNPPSLRKLAQIAVSFGPEPQKLTAIPQDELETLLSLPDSELRARLTELKGYDRSRDGGRGPSDIERPPISRDRYRDQKRQIQLLKEKLNTYDAELQAAMRRIKDLEAQNQEFQEIIQSNDQLRAAQATIKKLSEQIASYKASEAQLAALKADRETAIRKINEFVQAVLSTFAHFREQIYLPDLESAAWFQMMMKIIVENALSMEEFISAETLKRLGEEGCEIPSPEGAASALLQLTKPIIERFNFLKLQPEP